MENYIYLNEIKPVWTLMIVLYPYITGLVAGAFIVSSLYHVFQKDALKPVGKLSLVAAFCFLLFATTPLLAHLGHPERAFNIMITPHFTSAMSGFGFIYSFYLILLICEIWLLYREDLVRYAQSSTGVKKIFYTILSLGILDTSHEREKVDHKVIYFLAVLGIPSACILHGYVGFLFGALKSNPWWSTPLMPLIFILSAIVSGIALLVLFYMILCKIKKVAINYECVQTMVGYLFGFFALDFTLELLELLTMFYEAEEHLEALRHLISHKLMVSFVYGQILTFSVIPFVILFIITFFPKIFSRRNFLRLAGLASLSLLIQVFLMRWNVVIGGQMVSKSLKGFTSFHLEVLGHEGLLVGLAILIMPFVAFTVISKIIPLFKDLYHSTNQQH